MIRDEIRNYLISKRADGQVPAFSDGDSLLEAGVIDSLMMVDLIAYLEATFGISIDEEDMVPEHFDSIVAIASYVEARQPAAKT